MCAAEGSTCGIAGAGGGGGGGGGADDADDGCIDGKKLFFGTEA